MSRCEPATRIVLAALAGLVAAAIGSPLLGLLVAISWRPRALLAATALPAAAWGGLGVAYLDDRTLRPGPVVVVVVVASGAGRDPSPRRALVAGVTLGDTSGMSLADRDSFRASGLYHLVAVSGQNVALVVIFALACLALLGVIGAPARVAAIGLTLVYVLV